MFNIKFMQFAFNPLYYISVIYNMYYILDNFPDVFYIKNIHTKVTKDVVHLHLVSEEANNLFDIYNA